MKMNLAELKRLAGLDPNHKPFKDGKVLILDGNNVVGYRVADRLVKGGHAEHVRVGRIDSSETKLWDGVEEIKFVWEDETTYDDALRGMKTVFITIPSTYENWDKHFKPFLAACHKAKIRRIIKLSFFHSMQSKAEDPRRYFGDPDYKYSHDGFHKVPLVHQHALCDGDLILKGLDCTILFASHLMSNVLAYQGKSLRDEKKFYGASCGKGVNYVSPNDVADAAVLAILHPKEHRREGFSLLGAAPITDEKVARLLSKHLGTEIVYENKPLEFFDRDSAGLENIKASGLEEEASFPKGDFKRLVGKDPESFDAYLSDKNGMSPLELKAFPTYETGVNTALEKAIDVVVNEMEEKQGEDEIVKEEKEVAETKLHEDLTAIEQTPVVSQ